MNAAQPAAAVPRAGDGKVLDLGRLVRFGVWCRAGQR